MIVAIGMVMVLQQIISFDGRYKFFFGIVAIRMVLAIKVLGKDSVIDQFIFG